MGICSVRWGEVRLVTEVFNRRGLKGLAEHMVLEAEEGHQTLLSQRVPLAENHHAQPSCCRQKVFFAASTTPMPSFCG